MLKYIILSFLVLNLNASSIDLISDKLKKKSEIYKINKVNTLLNQYRYVSDKKLYGEKQHWATANEFFSNKAGDCEDFAIMKALVLSRAGVLTKNLYIHAYRLKNGEAHATLIVKTKKGLFELDNRFNKPKKVNKPKHGLFTFKKILRMKYS